MSVKAGQLYRHIRTNRLYKVLNIARNAATDDAKERIVVYSEVKLIDTKQYSDNIETEVFAQPETRFNDAGRFEQVMNETDKNLK